MLLPEKWEEALLRIPWDKSFLFYLPKEIERVEIVERMKRLS